MSLYCGSGAVLGWSFLLLHYLAGENFRSLLRTVHFLGYFSILSNMLSAFMLSVIALRGPQKFYLLKPEVIAGAALYMGITALPFVLLSLANTNGWLFLSDTGLHHVMPLVFIVFWLVYVPKGTLTMRHVGMWLILPATYGLYVLFYGQVTGFYPYPFLDAQELGLGQVLWNMGSMLARFLILSGFMVIIDSRLGRRRPSTAHFNDPHHPHCPM